MKKLPIFYILVFLLGYSFKISAQIDSTWKKAPSFFVNGFIDAFYIYDFNKPITEERQPFLYNHNRHNQINLNLAVLNLTVEHSKYRAKLSLQSGTYAQDNYAQEADIYKVINEAYVGLSLNKKNNLWLETGIFNSHLGFEWLYSIDNVNYTRSLATENLPYFLAGARVNYQAGSKWFFSGLVTNGWQRIQRVKGTSLLGYGTQVTYTPSKNVTFNWSTFICSDDPDSTRRMRYFNDFYGIIDLTKKFKLIVAFDLGHQQVSKGSSDYYMWLTPNLIGQYAISNQWKTSIRLEYFLDQNGVIIPTGTPNGFNTAGISANLDYYPIPNIACRFEARLFTSKDEVFVTDTSISSSDFFIGTSIAMKFNTKIKIR